MQKNAGFTLLECLVVIALSCLFLFSAAFAYREFINKNQLTALVNQFTDALEYARNTAITSGDTIILCPKNKNDSCGLNWQTGQLILDKHNQRVLRLLPAMPEGYRLLWKSTLGDSTQLQWRSDGFTRGQQGSFWFCGRNSSAQIIILRTGRWRVANAHCINSEN